MVRVLLSTYNGALYLNEQLESLLNQTHGNIKIDIRDDGSTDKTPEILHQFVDQNEFVNIYLDKNIGVAESFFTLLKNSPGDEYYCFSDQDDVWEPGKIEKALKELSAINSKVPVLYFSRLEYVDDQLNHIGFSAKPKRGASFENALVENIAIGCTQVMNKTARDLIVKYKPENCIMHDWWCYLVISAFGMVIYDDEATIKYRLHGENSIGVPESWLHKIYRRVKRFIDTPNSTYQIHKQAIEFRRFYGGSLSLNKCNLLDEFIYSKASFMRRFGFVFYPRVYRQNKFDSFMLRVLVILNKY